MIKILNFSLEFFKKMFFIFKEFLNKMLHYRNDFPRIPFKRRTLKIFKEISLELFKTSLRN